MRLPLAASVAASAIAGSLAVAGPATADDQRACVSRPEFRAPPGMTYMNGLTNPGRPLDRNKLEKLWDVAGLGVIDSDPDYTVPGVRTMWVYPVCGYSFTEAQVWVMVTGRSGRADLAMRWYEPGATSNGHEW